MGTTIISKKIAPTPRSRISGRDAASAQLLKQEIVGRAQQQKRLQAHINALENDLSRIDPAIVRSIIVPGYPLK